MLLHAKTFDAKKQRAIPWMNYDLDYKFETCRPDSISFHAVPNTVSRCA